MTIILIRLLASRPYIAWVSSPTRGSLFPSLRRGVENSESNQLSRRSNSNSSSSIFHDDEYSPEQSRVQSKMHKESTELQLALRKITLDGLVQSPVSTLTARGRHLALLRSQIQYIPPEIDISDESFSSLEKRIRQAHHQKITGTLAILPFDLYLLSIYLTRVHATPGPP